MAFRVSPQSVADWLRYFEKSDEPLNRLMSYENDLIALLQTGLNREHEFRQTFELLKHVFPYFALSLSHTEQWSRLLMDALLMAQDIKDNELQVTIFRWWGEAYLKSGQHQPASNAFRIGLERAESGEINDMLVAMYTGIFKLQWFDLEQDVTQPLLQQALDAAARVRDRGLRANLYDALASAYTRLSKTQIALGYGQTAFAYWYRVGNHSGLGRAAYTLASIYIYMTQLTEDNRFLDHAIIYLEIARAELAQTDDVWQYPLLAYQQAGIYYQLEDYEVAADWYEQSLKEAVNTNAPHYIVIAHHGLGLAQAKLKLFTAGRRNLLTALKSWETLHNSYEKGSVLVGLTDLELHAGNLEKSRAYLYTGLEVARSVMDNGMRQFLTDQVDDLESKLG
ncbi:MAG: hypothetical protein LCI00_32125 [Chloroflexi bacterium]|nr:hypothetical protein [Chloroflexota bacterium]